MTTYTVIALNHSTMNGNACVYQQAPNTADSNVMSLAWFSKGMHARTRAEFKWSLDYSFLWSETGVLVPGVLFSASETLAATLGARVDFNHDGTGYFFENETAGTPNKLSIAQGASIPSNQASVGIGMSGSGTFAVQAQPRMNAIFAPHPEYWITFGNISQGEVMDITSVTSQSGKIEFPNGVYSMAAILNEDNTWTVKPTSMVNAAFLAAKKQDPKALWGQLAA
jgi:hypothetical protein